MQYVRALLRQASRLWVIILRTALLFVVTLASVALIAFQWYTQSITIVGQPGAASRVIGLQEPIRVVFSQPMDEASVAEALQITPATAVLLSWNPQSTELSIGPRISWYADNAYVLHLAAPARSATLVPVDSWRMQFTTRAVLRVIEFLPAHLSTDVAQDSLVVVRFSQQMVPLVAVNIPLTQPILQISPPITNTQEWVDTATLTLRSEDLQPNQQYSVVVPAFTRDSRGRMLDTSVTHTFTTAADHIISVVPADGATDVGGTAPLIITVSGSLDATVLRSGVRVEPQTDITFDVQPTVTGATVVTIRPADRWEYATRYSLSFVDVGSQHLTAETHFTTAPALLLVAQSPPSGQPLQAQRDLRLVFNAPLDARTVPGAVHFSPQPVRPAQIECHGNEIRIRGVWATQVAPVLRIDTSLQSVAGNILRDEIIQTFAIDPRATVLSLPGELTDIPDISATGALPINMAPHTHATLTFTALSPATYARVRALSRAEFAAYDPTRYGILPVATIPITTELDPILTVDTTAFIPSDITTKIVLVRIINSKGAHDTRFVRILPTSMYALTIGTMLVTGVPQQNPVLPMKYDIFQAGARIASGVADDRGIWSTNVLKPGIPAQIVSRTAPYDVIERAVLESTARPLILQVLASQSRISAGAVLPVACSRNSADTAEHATALLTSRSGTIVNTRSFVWNAGQRIAQTTLPIPIDTDPGILTLSCVTPDSRSVSQLLLIPQETREAHIERTNSDRMGVVRITDAAQRPLADVGVFWREGSSFQTIRTDTSGRAQIPDTVPDVDLVVMNNHFRAIDGNISEDSLTIEPLDNWYSPGQPFTLTSRLIRAGNGTKNASIDLIVSAANGTIQQLRTIQSDDMGNVSTTMTLPAGEWQITLRAGVLTARVTAVVGVGSAHAEILPQKSAFDRTESARWLTHADGKQQLLVATLDDFGIQSTWSDVPLNGVFTTEPISRTSAMQFAYASTAEAFDSQSAAVIESACRTAAVHIERDENNGMRVNVTAPAGSTVAIGITDTTGALVAWRGDNTIPADGVLFLRVPQSQMQSRFDIRALIAHPFCQRVLTAQDNMNQLVTARIDVPSTVAVGDVVSVTYVLNGLSKGASAEVSLDPTGLIMVDPLPIYAQIADEAGSAHFQWNVRVVRAQPRLVISKGADLVTTWDPSVVKPRTSTSPDGFLLTGRTTLEAGRYDTPFDVLRSLADFATALDDDIPEADTAAQLAHLILLRRERHDVTPLIRSLLQAQHSDFTWGLEFAPPTDALITADVVIALAHAGGYEEILRPLSLMLHRAAGDSTLPLSVRAHAVYALSLIGERDLEAIKALCALRDTLGNEGLAAILLSAVRYPEIDQIPLQTTLAKRAMAASRGMQWAIDPATAGLHSPAAQHMLIAEALEQAGAATDVQAGIRTYLLSLRGVGGWGDAIANARAWNIHAILIPELDNTQRLVVTDSSGHDFSTRAMNHAQRFRDSTSIWSDRPVLVGIEYPRDLVPPTRDFLLRQHYTSAAGQQLAHIPLLHIGESVTVDVDVVALGIHPYATLFLPTSALTTLSMQTLPNEWSVEQTLGGYRLHLLQQQSGIWHLRYRITAIRTGSAHIEGIQVTDAAGTLHALEPTSTLHVTVP